MLLSLGRRSVSSDLVDLLLECHSRIRSFVDIASQVGAREELLAEEVHNACERCERYFTLALPLHVLDEEESLLPRLRGVDPAVDAALVAMHQQHEEHGPLLAAFLEALRAVRADPADRAKRRCLFEATAALERAFEEHLTNEERVIFPAVRKHLRPEIQAQILSELRARRA